MTVERVETWRWKIEITTQVPCKYTERVRGRKGLYLCSDIIVHTGNPYGDSIKLRKYIRKPTGESCVVKTDVFINEEINTNEDCISPHSSNIDKILGHKIIFKWTPSPSTK